VLLLLLLLMPLKAVLPIIGSCAGSAAVSCATLMHLLADMVMHV
jgi:hypothetical protein